MEALIDIVDWYASPLGTFIQMYNVEKVPHVLPNFSIDNIIMQEASYHILTGLWVRLHRKKKEPWPTRPLWIGLYEIQNLKYADAKLEEFKRFSFATRIFNLYDPHFFVKDHCARVKFPWIDGVCHWAKEDLWIYWHNFSRPNELAEIIVEWLAKQFLGEHQHQ